MKSHARPMIAALAAALLAALYSPAALACACGCGVFDVGTHSMFPNSAGGMIFVDYDYMNQNQDWSGSSSAQAAANADQDLKSHFLSVGAMYMFNQRWGAQIEVPMAFRYFATIDPGTGNLDTFNHIALGDVKLRGFYTGFNDDMTTGLMYGVRLPTGDSTFVGFDPDTEIGSGSTDLLLGMYHLGNFTEDRLWDWYAQINLDQPVLTRGGYFPGNEIDAAFGAYYDGLGFAGGNAKLAPILQLLAAIRASDHGGDPAADPLNTGYERLLLAPALEFDWKAIRFFASVEFPIYQYLNGYQLVASPLYKGALSYSF